MYLPRFQGLTTGESSEPVMPSKVLATGSIQILLVEDEESVRALTAEALKELGYCVLEANSAREALALLDAHPNISVLFTDVVMPETNGRKLAMEALRRKPSLRVLYATGYTRDATMRNGVLDPGMHLVGKPFTLDQLGRKLVEVLSD